MRRTSRHCGFTLIECLLVMAVLGLLAALLLPATGRARRQSHRAACLGNLHQLALHAGAYAGEHDGALPAAHFVARWSDTNPPPWTRVLLGESADPAVFRCPEFSRQHRGSAFNYFMGGRAAFINAGGQPAGVQFDRIRHPAEYILSGDANHPFQVDDADPDNYTQDTLFGTNSPAHAGRVNILFADLHAVSARKFEPGDMTFSYDSPGQDWTAAGRKR